MSAASEISYIDYETFLSPSFSPHAFASTLITSTNDPSDPTLDLSTPLSRVLFDLQEIDTHIHTLTTTSSQQLLTYTSTSHTASTSILAAIETQTAGLNAAYKRLEHDVISRSTAATEVVSACTRLHSVTSLLRELGRALVLARQLEIQLSELQRGSNESDRPIVRAAHSVLELQKLLAANSTAMDGVELARDLQKLVVTPAEAALTNRSREAIGSFSLLPPQSASSTTAFAVDPAVVAEGQKPVVTAALQTLHLLQPRGLTATIQALLNAQVTASISILTRALTALTTLDRTLLEVSARCRTLVAMEGMLAAVNLDADVLSELDTGALSTSFFRSVAAGWEPRVRDIIARGGANARILRSGRDRLREGVRGCVLRGLGADLAEEGRGEFEVAVMNLVSEWISQVENIESQSLEKKRNKKRPLNLA